MIDVDFNLFFDRPRVANSADQATRKVLSKAGAFVRRTARSKTRRAKRTSRPGEPPKGKTGLLRDLIFFQYQPADKSVVIGPQNLRLKPKPNGQTIPELLEFGGMGVSSRDRGLDVYYEPRPFMGPSLEENTDQFPGLFENSLR